MTDSNDDKTISVTGKKTLTLKPSGMSQGTVRQDMGRGRTKAVVVETRKRRPMRPEDEKPITPAAPAAPVRAAEPAPAPAQARPQQSTPAPRIHQPGSNQTNQRPQQSYQPSRPNDRPRPVVLNHLSPEEMDARRRALAESQARDAQDAIRRAEEEKRRAAEEVIRKAAEAEEAARRAAEEAVRQAEASAAAEPAAAAQAPAVTEARPNAPRPASPAPAARRPDGAGAPAAARPAPGATAPAGVRGRRDDGDDDDRGAARGGPARGRVIRPEPAKPVTTRPKTDEERRRGKLTITTADVDGDDNARGRSLSAMRRRQEKFRRSQMQETREKISREVVLPETITIQELSQRMSERAVDVIKFLMKEGQMMKPGDVIDADLAELIAGEFGHTVKRVSESDVELGIFDIADVEGDRVSRPPVVTIMGHVDHGKTSLLDAIRHANVVAGEAGGITQHIGAYQVEQNGQKITFIDTPGHAAFTAMRARGAQATDIAILVVAADDSVMPQTIESINHAKAAGVPIIVAINKIDKHEADPQKVRNQLLQHEVFVESMGGETLDVEVSAKTGKNLDKLLEAVLLQAEILDLKANPNRTAEGTVIEAQLDRGRGSVATVLVQNGTLKPGQIIVAGDVWGRVRALVNDKGDHMKEAPPAMPVEVLGLSGTPQAGDKFAVVESESRAREISEYRQRLARDKAAARQSGQRGSLEQMMTQMQSTGIKEFPLVIKGDVQGSIEAIAGALEKLGTDEVRARIVHSGAGGITESDISLAEASNAAIIGFNVRANAQARQFAERQGIEIRYYNIIYDLVDDVKAAMSGLLSPERRETFIGNAEILEVFNITKVGKVAGCRVVEGKVERGAGVRLIRDDVVVHEGKLKTLKRFKDEVSEVPMGQECGMAFENYEDMRVGDVIECFRVEHITRTL
ncbi:translation initiation factor IF-2 [Rhizobium bangladeshense]|uniref:Translation initiation factor IF-2 n=1 Tax=Rhizobium bangladeshense TaxID=1138189 RepID=A0ABS7LFJ6_9HYPH|nr:translation initiation factor IF-2 [Rhizobium bangladeshense]MBX4866234.1 translation initiation factor IF-2 [Rhizobium bangladeshense]MBX4876151.1 translation initiation factor IF-2 [Rhizobium bangladeshense]MBX4887116.1 translation initiation factor IF-2 [Rhizobium bangladeshense]MBY3590004.1 translation initiation factor IF-2 [Rhizobium bangladeshense]MBY3599676.1 translation initiation factor IF-2 [Rhizobium bangladeshense]